jgi:hypothetical protein
MLAGTDITPIVPALEKIWRDSKGQQLADFNFRTVTSKFNELVYQYPIRYERVLCSTAVGQSDMLTDAAHVQLHLSTATETLLYLGLHYVLGFSPNCVRGSFHESFCVLCFCLQDS